MFDQFIADFNLNFIQGKRWLLLLKGLGSTLLITLLALMLGIVIGVVIAMVRSTYDKTAADARKTFGRFMFRILNGFCKLYLTVLRGTPVVVQLMIIYFVIFASSDNGMHTGCGAGVRSEQRRICSGDRARRHHVHR